MGADFEIRPSKAGVRFDVRVMPRAPRTTLGGVRDGRLLIRVSAPPVDGAANDAVIALLAARLGVPRGAIAVVSGETARNKTIEIAGLTETAMRAAIGAI